MNGWVKLHRKSLDHWLYNESRPHTRREAWEDILLLANHENTKVMIEGELIECKTGQSVMSLKSWAKQFKWTIQQVRTFFSLLQKDEMLHIEGLRKTTRVTVCNYVNYQYEQHTNNTEITRRQHGDNTETTTNKKGKKDKKDKEDIYPADFLIFWEAYPKKKSKDDALKAWQKKKDKPPITEILDKLKLQIASNDWTKDGGQFIPYPATYINRGGWHDEIKPKKLVVVL